MGLLIIIIRTLSVHQWNFVNNPLIIVNKPQKEESLFNDGLNSCGGRFIYWYCRAVTARRETKKGLITDENV